MKISALIAFGALALLAGCDSVASRMDQRFSPVPPHIRSFAAERRAVFAAGQTAVKNVGLLLGRTSFDQGRIDGYAPIRPGDATRDTRQTTIEVRLTETADGETQVAVLVWDHTEGSFPGGVSEQAFREHGLYGSYFAALQQVLMENGSLKAGAKP